MTDIPKGHHGSPGIIPVFLPGEYVHRLHLWAEKYGLVDQFAATVLLRGILDAIDSGEIEISVFSQNPELN